MRGRRKTGARWGRGGPPPGRQSGSQAVSLPRPIGVPATITNIGGFRFRKHLVPFLWLGAMLAMGLISHAAHSVPGGVVSGAVAALLIVVGARHLTDYARTSAGAAAGLTAVWVPVLSVVGWSRPVPLFLLGTWTALMVPWVRHYRWRGESPEPELDTSDIAVWQRLAGKRKWAGHLAAREEIPGGHRWLIRLDGAETHIGEILAHPRPIAAAWGKPVTEAYTEPSPDGIENKGYLTILRKSGLREVRAWDGSTIDPATGFAKVGRFPDGESAHEQYFARGDGVYHKILAGATGAGKSAALDLDVAIALSSGLVVPIIMDPQQGQSMPAWREKLITAEGLEECMARLRGIHAGMLARSAYLARFEWEHRGKLRKGVGFFDPFLTRLPIIEAVLDEAPALLTPMTRSDNRRAEEATRIVSDLAVRGRKAGVRLVLAAGIPSLDNLGGDRALRSMLSACNTVCLRTAQAAEAGMVGILADPSQLPRFFPDRAKTQGLGYIKGPDNRPGTPFRTDYIPDAYEIADSADVPEMDDVFREAMEKAMEENTPCAITVPPPVAPSSNIDVVWNAIVSASQPLDRGEVLHEAKKTGIEGGLLQGVSLALEELMAGTTDGRKIVRTDDETYVAVKS